MPPATQAAGQARRPWFSPATLAVAGPAAATAPSSRTGSSLRVFTSPTSRWATFARKVSAKSGTTNSSIRFPTARIAATTAASAPTGTTAAVAGRARWLIPATSRRETRAAFTISTSGRNLLPRQAWMKLAKTTCSLPLQGAGKAAELVQIAAAATRSGDLTGITEREERDINELAASLKAKVFTLQLSGLAWRPTHAGGMLAMNESTKAPPGGMAPIGSRSG